MLLLLVSYSIFSQTVYDFNEAKRFALGTNKLIIVDFWAIWCGPCRKMDVDVRPKACREFPRTDRKKFQQISNLTLKNVTICPAAFNIVEEMKKKLSL